MLAVASNLSLVKLRLGAMMRGNTERVDIGWWGDTLLHDANWSTMRTTPQLMHST